MKKLTLSDIAKKASVSKATVSRILAGVQSQIPPSEKTRRKVLKIAKEFDYRPNVYARLLRKGRTYVIGVAISDIEDQFFGPVMRGIQEAAVPHNYHFLITDLQDNGRREKASIEYFLSQRVEGIILAGNPEGYGDESIRRALKEEIPCVLLERESRLDLPFVKVDDEQGGYLATEHLLKLNHTKIAFLSGPSDKPESRRRLEGYKKALENFGTTFNKKLVTAGNHSPESGYKAMKKFMRKHPEVTACFCYNDLLALGAMKAIVETGKRIPDDFSLVGFDDIAIARYTAPPLTTIRQPTRELGKRATSLLLEILSGENKSPVKRILLQPELIVRETTRKND